MVIGRGIRYFSEGILAVVYGPAAIQFVQNNYGKIGIAVAAIILLSGLVYFSFARRRVRSSEA